MYFFSTLLLGILTLILSSKIVSIDADDPFVVVRDQALPKYLLQELGNEVRVMNKYSNSLGTVDHGKYKTNWISLCDVYRHPRNYIELTIRYLSQFIPESERKIIGAEWWVQIREKDEDISFHYDKDEGMASIQQKMVFPVFGTVTYMTPFGGPTFVLNMTTIDGNSDVPLIPQSGYMVYPEVNRHIIFRGNLLHGVLGKLSMSKYILQDLRITLLVNWWDRRPVESNCVYLSDTILASLHLLKTNEIHEMKKNNIWNPDEIIKKHPSLADCDPLPSLTMESEENCSIVMTPGEYQDLELWNPQIMLATAISMTKEFKSKQRLNITLFPGDFCFLDLPNDLYGSYYRQHINYFAFQWDHSTVFGPIGYLDLTNSKQVSRLFRLTQPKILFLYHEDTIWRNRLLRLIQPLVWKYQEQLKIYLSPSHQCQDLFDVFHLSSSDLPCHIFHDTTNDRYFIQKGSDFLLDRKSIENHWIDGLIGKKSIL